jgi:ankyrin repeat protein
VALRKALKTGDWETAEDFLNSHPDARTSKITFRGQTALHLAVDAGHECIVEKLVGVMSEEDLAIQTNNGNTALAYAISEGNRRMTKCMLEKNKNLVSIKDQNSNIPANQAIFNGHTELGRRLYSRTPLEDLTQEKAVNGATLCSLAIYNRSLGNNLSLTIHRSLFLMI